MVSNDRFTIFRGTRVRTAVETNDDLDSGTFSDEESVPRVLENDVPGRITTPGTRAFNENQSVYRLTLPHDCGVQPDDRVEEQSTGTIYVVSSVIKSKLAGGNTIAILRA